MKKRSLLILIIYSVIILSGINVSNATITEQYQKWSELSDEDKEKTIQPRIYNINIEDGVKASSLKKYATLKENIENKYFLGDNINIKVKNQKSTSACWSFPIISSLETNIAIKSKKDSSIYSTRHMEYATSKTFLDGINKLGFNREVGSGGDFRIGFAYMTNGNGPVLEKDMPFEDNEKQIKLADIDKKVDKKITEYEEFPGVYKEYDLNGKLSSYTNGYTGIYKKIYTEDEIKTFRAKIKEHIKENGALTAYTYVPKEKEEYLKYFNTQKVANEIVDTYSYYFNDSTNAEKTINHAVTIVGWDDSYAKENFAIEPKNDGAYIVLNSWGEEQLNEGYYYVSYDDAYIESCPMGVSNTENIDYDTIYQYDEYGCSYSIPFNNTTTNEELKSIYVANVFDRDETNKPIDGKDYAEYINEVGIYVSTTSGVEIYINAESDDLTKIEKVATAEKALEPGYHTIKLSSPIKLTGDKFVVAARYSNQDGVEVPLEFNYKSNIETSNYWDVVTSKKGESYISPSLEGWSDLTDVVLYQEDTNGDGIADENVCFKDTNICVKGFTTFEEIKKDIKVESISLNEKTKTMEVGDTANLVVTINPTDATNKNVIWSSSDEKVVTVSEKGIITAVKVGTTTITVTSEDGNKTATCNITVKEKTNIDDNKYKAEDEENGTNIAPKEDIKEAIKENNNSSDTNKESIKTNQDTTVSNKILPYTGKIKIILSVISIVILSIAIFIKYRKMKDIK